jgi:spore maturation protein CgeB
LLKLGARSAHPLYWGVDPEVFSPMEVSEQDIDVLFCGHGREYRSDWMDTMITGPSQVLTQVRFAARGKKLGDLGRAENLPYQSFTKCVNTPAGAKSI